MTMQKQKITPFLWFDTQAEEAVKFYLSVFKDGKTTATTYYGSQGPGRKGSVMTVAFELNGQGFVALNGGPDFKFTEAVSFVINCDTQKEVDYYWDKLVTGGGKHLECGWLKDKYGLCWQIVPTMLWDLIADKDAAKAERVKQAVWKMTKLNIAKLQSAANAKA